MKVKMRIEYHYAETPGIPLLQSADERQRNQVVASQCNGHAPGLTRLAGNSLRAFKRMVSRINDPQIIREAGEVEFGGNPALMFERVNDAGAADGIRRFVSTEAGVEGFGRARSWRIKGVAIAHENAFVWDSEQDNVACVTFGERRFEECGNISLKHSCNSAFSHISSFGYLKLKDTKKTSLD
jgi:hypothetical protein